jgi:hypothetical protein
MDYQNAPAFVVIRHLLFRTSQGTTYLFFSALNLLAGAISLTAPASIATGELLRAGSFFLVYPLLLFFGLLRFSYHDDFESSWTTAVFVAIAGMLPFAWPYLHDAVA